MGRLARTGAGAALLVVLAGCGGGGGAATDGDGGSDGDRLDWDDSPLQVALWGEASLQPFDEEEGRARELEVQESIRACMAEEGFDYTPFVWEMAEGDDIWADQSDDPVAWAREHGFGWADGYQLSGNDVEDPNQAYAESLDDAAREAFYAALYGTGPDVASDEDGNPIDADGNLLDDAALEELYGGFEPDGCESEAYEAAWGPSDGEERDSEAMLRVEELYTDLEERLQADERVQALDAGYAACMAEAGHDDLGDEEAVWRLLEAKEQELEIWVDPFADVSEDEMAAMTQEEIDRVVEAQAGPDAEKLAELKAFEVELAVPHATCVAPVEQERLAIRFELEQELVDDPANAELFARVREQVGGDDA